MNLRIDDKPGVDTRYHVRNVLTFVSEAFDCLQQGDTIVSSDAIIGASHILRLCVYALREPDSEESGASDVG